MTRPSAFRPATTVRPATVDEAAAASGEFRAGGTDLHARRRLGISGGDMVDLGDLADLRGIDVRADGGYRLGAMTRIATVATDERILAAYPALALTAGSLATPQIRAVGTLGGNLLQRNRCPYFRHPEFSCHQSGGTSCPARGGDHSHGVIFDLGACVTPHASSLAMALLTYDASVVVSNDRSISLPELLGDGSDPTRDHQLEEGEVLVAVEMPPPVADESGAYRRATSRALAEWPQVEAAARLVVDEGGVIRFAAVAVGGVARVPLRLAAVEDALVGTADGDRAGHERAASRGTEAARPLPMTGHKVELLTTLVSDVVAAALSGTADSEAAPGERGLPRRSQRQ